MFNKETVQQYLISMRHAIDTYGARYEVKPFKASVSPGNNKIGHVPNVSLPPIFSCGHCAQCGLWCYDIRDCFRHGWNFVGQGPSAARAKNWVRYKNDPVGYFRDIQAYLEKYEPEYFRWHVGGDTPDRVYRDGMVQTAEMFETQEWTYTKEYEMWNEVVTLPKKLIVMYSEWRGLPMDNPHNRPVFRVRFKGEPVPSGCTWKCPGNCDVCRAAKRGCVVGENTWVDEH